MHLATQAEVDAFMAKAILNPKIYPYLSVDHYLSERVVEKGDWQSMHFIDSNLKCLLCIRISRAHRNSFNVALYSESKYLAGKAIKLVERLVPQYDCMSITTCVHESNVDSLLINNKIFGEPWGIETKSAWNRLTCKWESLHWFKKDLY